MLIERKAQTNNILFFEFKELYLNSTNNILFFLNLKNIFLVKNLLIYYIYI
jgi:hypothetical protein